MTIAERLRDDRGALSLEAVILFPVLILVLLLVLRKPIERADGIVPGQTEKQKEAAQ